MQDFSVNMKTLYLIGVLLSVQCWHTAGEEALYGHEDPANNIIKNWDFEEDLTPSEWKVSKSVVSRTDTEKYTGNYSIFVSKRTHKFGGVTQRLVWKDDERLIPDKNYYVSLFIKFANNNSSPGYIKARLMYKVNFVNKSLTYQGPAARLHFQFADGDWNQLGGDLRIPNPGLPTPQNIEIFVQVEPLEIDYYLDTFAMTRITELGSDWKGTLQAKISQVRRRRVKIVTTIPNDIVVNSTKVVVNMTRHVFNWGPALADWHLAGNTTFQQNLKAYMKKIFTWATFGNSMKWLRMEQKKGDIKFHPTEDSIRWLLENGFRVRGHTLLWEIMEANPLWIYDIHGQDMVNEMWRRINYTLAFWNGRIVEWDMCNEYLNNHFYEDRSGIRDLSLLSNEFKYAHSLDPVPRLCVNEYRVLRDGQLTSAEANLAMKLKRNGAPVSCLAAQSHLRLGDADDYDIERYLKRLQIISAADLPITISEFSVQATNVTSRAHMMEKLLYAIYSEPKVHNVIFWSLSDQPQLAFEGDSNFVEGIDFQPNEVGQVLEHLLLSDWRSEESYTPKANRYKYLTYLYHGEYKVILYVNGTVHKEVEFTLNPSSSQFRIRIKF